MKKLRNVDGNYDFIYESTDFANILEDKLGIDHKNYFLEINSKADYTKAKVNSDLTAYELELENNRDTIQDVLDIIENLYYEVEKKRLDRTRILEKLNSIESKLVNMV